VGTPCPVNPLASWLSKWVEDVPEETSCVQLCVQSPSSKLLKENVALCPSLPQSLLPGVPEDARCGSGVLTELCARCPRAERSPWLCLPPRTPCMLASCSFVSCSGQAETFLLTAHLCHESKNFLYLERQSGYQKNCAKTQGKQSSLSCHIL
jgi:hypothetical protein